MKIDVTKLAGKLLEYADLADKEAGFTNGKYYDNATEISLFWDKVNRGIANGEVSKESVNEIFGLQKQVKTNVKTQKTTSQEEEAMQIYLAKLTDEEKADVTYKTRTSSDEEFLKLSYGLDNMLIQNEITGAGAILNRLPRYSIERLADRYLTLQERFNKAEYEVENWFNDPSSTKPEIVEKNLFEENAEKILGMPYKEYAEKNAEALKKVAALPPILRGVSSLAEILLHERELAKLSEEELYVYRQIVTLNSVLATNFNAWENDIMYKSIDISSEANIDVMESLNDVSMNEYADENDFKMPENWLVKKNFIKSIEEVSGSTGIDDITANSPKNEVKKYIIDGKVVIKKNNNGKIEYYDISGRKQEKP